MIIFSCISSLHTHFTTTVITNCPPSYSVLLVSTPYLADLLEGVGAWVRSLVQYNLIYSMVSLDPRAAIGPGHNSVQTDAPTISCMSIYASRADWLPRTNHNSAFRPSQPPISLQSLAPQSSPLTTGPVFLAAQRSNAPFYLVQILKDSLRRPLNFPRRKSKIYLQRCRAL